MVFWRERLAMKRKGLTGLLLSIPLWVWCPTTRADFDVATSSSFERKPAIAYNSISGKFLVAYLVQCNGPGGVLQDDLRCQLLNADGSKNGPELDPLGSCYIHALSRPALAYNPKLDIFFVAVAEHVDTPGYDRVIGRFLNGDGSNRIGPDWAFDTPASSPQYQDGDGVSSVRVVCNTLLNEFVVTMQRNVWGVDWLGNPAWQAELVAKRFSETTSYPTVKLTTLSYQHALAYAPIAGTTPPGGRYLFLSKGGTELLDSQLNLVTSVPEREIGWNADAAYGEVEGKGCFLKVFTDQGRCNPYKGIGNGPCPDFEDQWTGVWGIYIDPTIVSYSGPPPAIPNDGAFPISAIAHHAVDDTQAPRVSYSADAKGFFVVWREEPVTDPSNDQSLSHIRGAFVDYGPSGGIPQPPANVVISEVTGTCPNPQQPPDALYCASLEDPILPDVAAAAGSQAAVVWQQHYPSLIKTVVDFDIRGDFLSPYNTPTGSSVNVNRNGNSVTFDTITSPGFTEVTQSASGPPLPANFEQSCTPPHYFDIITTATYSGQIQICLSYDPNSCDASNLRLFHLDNGAWVDVTTSVNTTTHTICGTVTSLSSFALVSVPLPDLTFGPVDPNASPLTLTLHWVGAGYFLEEAQSIPNWSSSQAVISHTGSSYQAIATPAGGVQFYRLRDDSKFPSVHGHPVGYIAVQLPGGWSLTSSPFVRSAGSDTLNDLFELSDQYFGTVVARFDAAAGWIPSVYLGTVAGWWPNLNLPLGEGIVLGTANGLPLTLQMAGPLAVGKPVVHIPAGLSITAPAWPSAQNLVALGYPLVDWDWVFKFDNSTGNFFGYCSLLALWWPWDFTPPVPVDLSLCESFISCRANAVDWVCGWPPSLP
jgi:hypothetical protein